MNARPVTHPSADTLQAFGLGKLTDTLLADTVLQHVETCAECRDQVAAVSGDTFIEGLRAARQRCVAPIPTREVSDMARAMKAAEQASTTPPKIPDLPAELRDHPQYEVQRELGRGGMGVVYLVRNKPMDRLEVLKVVSKALLDRPGAIQRFQREIRSAAKLSHPNIVIAYHAPQVGDLLAFAMEYVPGENLAEVVKANHGPLPVLNCCYYIQQVVLGLQHAFEKGMVHRDIKPHNLILAKDGKKHIVKILDFGLAKARSEAATEHELTGAGQMLGTPDYMAPEQWRDAANADIRADIYSLGCTLYFLLSGHAPFTGSSLPEIWEAHQSRIAKPLNEVGPEVPPELAAVVAKMMAKNPAQRYQKPVEVAQALLPFIKAEGKGTSVVGAKSMPQAQSKGTAEAVRRDTVMEGHSTIRPAPKRSATQTQRLPSTVAAKRKWPVIAGVVAAALLLALAALWVSGVIRVKTKDGVIVLEDLPADAEVFVDGEKVTVTWGDNGKKAEVRAKPGTRKVEVKKDGFIATGEEVEVQAEGRTLFRAHLEQGVAAVGHQPGLSLRPLNRMAMVRAGQWSVEGDQLIQGDATMQFPDVLFGDFEWTDYDFSAQARRVEGNDLFALYGRWFDGNTFKFQVGSGFGNDLTRLDQGAWAVVKHSPFSIQSDVLYKTVLKVRGNGYQVVINNQVVTDYVDPVNVSGQGRVGLGTNMAACRFTKIEVRSRTGKLLWTGPPDLDPPKPPAGDQPVAVGLEPLEQPAPKPGAPDSPTRTLLPGSVLVGVYQIDQGGTGPTRIEITERTDDVFKGTITWDGFFGMRTFALAGTLRGSEVKWEVGNVLVKQGKLPAPAANNQGFVGKFERGMLEGRFSSHDGKGAGVQKLSLAAVYTGTYEFVTGAAAKGALRIEITERQENHFKGTLTSDDGPTTWVITGTVAKDEVQWQWGDMASKDGGSSEILTNNCRFAGTCKDGIVQGRFSTLDNAQTGSLRATLVGLKSAGGKE